MEAKLILRSMAAGLCLGFLMAAPAKAAVITTYTDKTAFQASVTIPPGNTVTIGDNRTAPNMTLNGFASSESAGPVTVTAGNGLAGDGHVLSTDQDQATLVVRFNTPVLAIGLTPFITDVNFTPILGRLQIVLVGSGTETLRTGSPSFIGYRSDTAISSMQISVSAFDTNISAVAFATLTDSIFVGEPAVQSIPAPGFDAIVLALFVAIILHAGPQWYTGQGSRQHPPRTRTNAT